MKQKTLKINQKTLFIFQKPKVGQSIKSKETDLTTTSTTVTTTSLLC